MSPITRCPCCNSTVRVDDGRIEAVVMTKPETPWKPGTAREAIERVCREEGVSLALLASPSRVGRLSRIRHRAVLAAAEAGADNAEIGRLLNRRRSSIQSLIVRRGWTAA